MILVHVFHKSPLGNIATKYVVPYTSDVIKNIQDMPSCAYMMMILRDIKERGLKLGCVQFVHEGGNLILKLII